MMTATTMRWAVGLLLLTATGCGATATTGGAADAGAESDGTIMPSDTGVRVDAGTIVDRGGGNCPAPNPLACVQGTIGGQCGDGALQGVCSNGQWVCPQGTVRIEQCACSGRPSSSDCQCVQGRGWVCPRDAGRVDTGPAQCPNPLPQEGTACGNEGQSCGPPCTDPCQFCNILLCQGGRWSRLEAHPDPNCRRDAGGGEPDAGTVDCDPSHAACNALPGPCSGGGEVREVVNGCWGQCVLYTRCAPIECDPDRSGQCPPNLVCFRTNRRCGPPV